MKRGRSTFSATATGGKGLLWQPYNMTVTNRTRNRIHWNPEYRQMRPSLPPASSIPGEHKRIGRAALMRRSEEHTSELQSRENLVCRLLLEKKKTPGLS